MKKYGMKIFVGFLVFIMVFLIFTFIFFSKGNTQVDNKEEIQKKTLKQIDYMDSKIIEMLNTLNNIVLENDYISIQEINENSSKDSSQEKSNEEGKQETSKSKKENDSSSQEEQKKETQTEIKNMGISEQKNSVDWQVLSSNMELIYNAWSSMILDLYKVNANNQDILDVSTELDRCAQFINKEEKTNCTLSLSKVYTFLPKFAESSSQESKVVNILKVKSNILNSYAYVEQDNWEKVIEEIEFADNNYKNILSSIPENENSIYNVNKAYIVLKELQISLSLNDKEVYYIKYKNLISELNKLSNNINYKE